MDRWGAGARGAVDTRVETSPGAQPSAWAGGAEASRQRRPCRRLLGSAADRPQRRGPRSSRSGPGRPRLTGTDWGASWSETSASHSSAGGPLGGVDGIATRRRRVGLREVCARVCVCACACTHAFERFCCAHLIPNIYLMYFSFCLLPTLPPQERLLWLIDLMEVPSFLPGGAVGVP